MIRSGKADGFWLSWPFYWSSLLSRMLGKCWSTNLIDFEGVLSPSLLTAILNIFFVLLCSWVCLLCAKLKACYEARMMPCWKSCAYTMTFEEDWCLFWTSALTELSWLGLAVFRRLFTYAILVLCKSCYDALFFLFWRVPLKLVIPFKPGLIAPDVLWSSEYEDISETEITESSALLSCFVLFLSFLPLCSSIMTYEFLSMEWRSPTLDYDMKLSAFAKRSLCVDDFLLAADDLLLSSSMLFWSN